MIVRCKECGKKYKIDETKIKGRKARVKCKSCHSMIDIIKPESLEEKEQISENLVSLSSIADTAPKNETHSQDFTPPISEESVRKRTRAGLKPKDIHKRKTSRLSNLTIGIKLLIMFLGSVIIMGSVLAFVYLKYVPSLMSEQIDLRTYSISRSFSAAVLQPLLLRNYLRVNQTAESNSRLPGVAYVSVINNKRIIIAGIFGDLKRFSPNFVAMVKKQGFPKALSSQNQIPKGKKESAKDLIVGGQKIHDVAVPIGDTGGETHVGIFTEDVDKAVRKSMIPLLIILVVMTILGSLSFLMIARNISAPIRLLTDEAHRISLGEIDHPINVQGGGEIAELAASLERMRFSIQSAIERLRNR
jgi:predicted Zn finger-like uncharacterized protein